MSAQSKRKPSALSVVEAHVGNTPHLVVMSLDEVARQTGIKRYLVEQSLRLLCQCGSLISVHGPGRPPVVWKRTETSYKPRKNCGVDLVEIASMNPGWEFTFDDLPSSNAKSSQTAIKSARKLNLITKTHSSQLYYREMPPKKRHIQHSRST